MNNGDMVVATTVPVEITGVNNIPDSVIGRLEIVPVSFGTAKWTTYLVWVEDNDGEQVPIEVDGKTIERVNRRVEATVLS